MVKNLEDLQKFNTDNIEAVLKSFDAYAKNVQAIAQEVTEYTKNSMDDGAKAVEKLVGAKTLDSAIEIQSDYLKQTYEGFVSEASKLGTLYAELARETYKPFESQIARASATR